MKLKKYLKITGVFRCENGLRIGTSKDNIEIGGIDNPIIRDPISQRPYVPGSSLKGKIRPCWKSGGTFQRARRVPCDCGNCMICKVFGCGSAARAKKLPASWCGTALTDESIAALEKARAERGVFFSEEKSEVSIDRRTGKAASMGPRTTERIPAGTEFNYEIVLRVYENDDEAAMKALLKRGMDLLQHDYLGASGSRGYGKVSFKDQREQSFDA
ncbi:type III-A CRISPR-associated RAMP protein Csm3 [bacterium]|nr:type III-A CRISPR-associated RAMP protein Csm3 [bacterium]